ncbi:uncharacterized protein LOC124939862 [Impatiens glandulifera]|uniref:uncharacterized protein LOC124939862 n=1 Tax=Impatiens glandulifera TaxID=253017 RepID=UPI001FB0F228|nr:uncharacterized protein LOC124939862 [Impatiens glandulifera]
MFIERAMEATEDLLTKIRPPRLEDAGLEDCALPPESIKEAFLKAVTAVRSRPSFFFSESDDESDTENVEGCVVDPWPETKESSDKLFGIRDGIDQPPSEPCSSGGGVPEVVVGDDVAEVEELKKEEEIRDACVDGLKGLMIGERKELKKKDEDRKEPTLVEGYI